MSAKFIAVYPVVTQHPWTSVDIRNEVVGSIPTLASKISKIKLKRIKKSRIDAGVGRLNPYPSVRVSEGSDKERVPA